MATMKSIRGKALRITKLDECGNPIAVGPAVVVTKGFASIQLSPQYIDGEDTEETNANGDLCIQDKAPDKLKNIEIEATLCEVDFDMVEIMTGQKVLVDAAGESVGNVFGQADEVYFALEVWSDIPGATCGAGAKPFLYHVLPYIASARLGDFTVEKTAATFTFTANTRPGTNWGAGPYNVQMAGTPTAVPAPLITPFEDTDHYAWIRSTVPVPTVTDGAVTLALAPGYHTPTP